MYSLIRESTISCHMEAKRSWTLYEGEKCGARVMHTCTPGPKPKYLAIR